MLLVNGSINANECKGKELKGALPVRLSIIKKGPTLAS